MYSFVVLCVFVYGVRKFKCAVASLILCNFSSLTANSTLLHCRIMKRICIISTWKLHIAHRTLMWPRHCDTSLVDNRHANYFIGRCRFCISFNVWSAVFDARNAREIGVSWRIWMKILFLHEYIENYKNEKKTKLQNLNCERLYVAPSKLYCFFFISTVHLKTTKKRNMKNALGVVTLDACRA